MWLLILLFTSLGTVSMERLNWGMIHYGLTALASFAEVQQLRTHLLHQTVHPQVGCSLRWKLKRGLLKNPWKLPLKMEVWVGNSMKIIELNGGLWIFVMFDYCRVPLLEMMEHEPRMVWLLGWFMIGFTAFGGFKCRFYIMYEAFPMAYTTSPKWGLYSKYNYLIRPTWLQTKLGFCLGYTNIGGRAYTLL
jgi:hypothetical protein